MLILISQNVYDTKKIYLDVVYFCGVNTSLYFTMLCVFLVLSLYALSRDLASNSIDVK
jgi:hypothetical protein